MLAKFVKIILGILSIISLTVGILLLFFSNKIGDPSSYTDTFEESGFYSEISDEIRSEIKQEIINDPTIPQDIDEELVEFFVDEIIDEIDSEKILRILVTENSENFTEWLRSETPELLIYIPKQEIIEEVERIIEENLLISIYQAFSGEELDAQEIVTEVFKEQENDYLEGDVNLLVIIEKNLSPSEGEELISNLEMLKDSYSQAFLAGIILIILGVALGLISSIEFKSISASIRNIGSIGFLTGVIIASSSFTSKFALENYVYNSSEWQNSIILENLYSSNMSDSLRNLVEQIPLNMLDSSTILGILILVIGLSVFILGWTLWFLGEKLRQRKSFAAREL
jgi:hypothetical protein